MNNKQFLKRAGVLANSVQVPALHAAVGYKGEQQALLREWQRVRSLVGDYTHDTVLRMAERTAGSVLRVYNVCGNGSVSDIADTAAVLSFNGLGAESLQLFLSGLEISASCGSSALKPVRSSLMRHLSADKTWKKLMAEKKKWLCKSAKSDINRATRQYIERNNKWYRHALLTVRRWFT